MWTQSHAVKSFEFLPPPLKDFSCFLQKSLFHVILGQKILNYGKKDLSCKGKAILLCLLLEEGDHKRLSRVRLAAKQLSRLWMERPYTMWPVVLYDLFSSHKIYKSRTRTTLKWKLLILQIIHIIKSHLQTILKEAIRRGDSSRNKFIIWKWTL